MTLFRTICMGKLRLECYGCGCGEASIIFVQKYKGYRGVCPSCGSNWPES